MTDSESHSHDSSSLPRVSHIKKLEEPDDYTEWSQDVQATLMHGGWWKYICPPPDFPTTDPDYIPFPNPLHDQITVPVTPVTPVVDDPGTRTHSAMATVAASIIAAATETDDAKSKLMAHHREWVRGDNATRHVIRSTIAHRMELRMCVTIGIYSSPTTIQSPSMTQLTWKPNSGY
jgi:hypothetical protein